MPIPDRIAALFNALTLDDLNSLPPAERRRFADTCRHWADRADPPKVQAPKAGVLASLKDGERSL